MLARKDKVFTKDDLIILLALLYVTVPIMIFFLGWLKIFISILTCLILIFFTYKIYRSLCNSEIKLIEKSTCGYWAVTSAVSALWVYLSGIGSYVYQNSDYWARNPIFRDLSAYSWPVIYDFSTQTEVVQGIMGSGTAAFAYYYTWWLPVAGTVKLFGLGEAVGNFLLYLWAFIGIMLIIYCINRYIGRCSYVSTAVFILFSGLDIVGFFLRNFKIPLTDHMEWWAGFCQYSSNTTQLFWVFNQSIPVWLIVGILLQLRDNRYIAAISSLTFAYSPWATLGILPIATGGGYAKEKGGLKQAFHIINMLLPLVMLIVYGSFYLGSSGSTGGVGTIFSKYPDKAVLYFCIYILFVILEVGIYFLIMGKSVCRYNYYKIILAELFLMPLFYVRDGNFVMRGSIPALFILMVFIIKFLTDQTEALKWRKRLLVFALAVGAFTPFTEINRTVVNTLSDGAVLQEDVYSFGAIRTDNQSRIKTAKNQFYIFDYENSFFFRYLAKTNLTD